MKKWTAIFLIYADLKTKNPNGDPIQKSVDNLFKQISDCNLNGNINILRIYNQVNITGEGKLDNDATDLHELYKKNNVENDWKPIEKTNTTRSLVQKKEFLIEYLKKIREHYPAENYALFTWDHGAAFGIFQESEFTYTPPRTGRKIVESLFKRANINQYVIYKNDTKHLTDYKRNDKEESFTERLNLTGDLLSNDELADIIKEGLGSKVDILIMMNCYMHNMHLCSDIYQRVDYLIAPQGDIYDDVYNYTNILNEMATGISPAFLSEKVITQVEAKAMCHPMKKDLAIFSSEIASAYHIVALLKSLFTYLLVNIKNTTFKTDIIYSINQCYEFDGHNHHLVDISHFLIRLQDILKTDRFIFETTINYNKLVNVSLTGKAPTFIYTKGHPGDFDISNPPRGYTIFFPKDRDFIDDSEYAILKTELSTSRTVISLLKQTMLNSFLNEFYQINT